VSTPEPELSRPVRLDEPGALDRDYRIEATPDERAALARRFDLRALESLRARVRLEEAAEGGALVRLDAALEAAVVQTCVVTLEPVPAHITATFRRLYDPQGMPAAEPGEEEFLALDADEPPEPLAGGLLDLGEAVAEQLALELDPFPRAPGVDFHGFATESLDSGEKPAPDGPFAGLAKLLDEDP
jgi:uncharacterized metal-binding protein YceD (DUF177 family)